MPVEHPIHIPKDAYADSNFLEAICLCETYRTTPEVNGEMARIAPDRAHLAGELEVQRDRLDFATYSRLLHKKADEQGRTSYRLSGSGGDLCGEHEAGELSPHGLDILRRSVLDYSTANEARAAREYRGHSSRPFLLALRMMYEISESETYSQVLNDGIPKRILSDCVAGLWTEDEDELHSAIQRLVRWVRNDRLYEPELKHYVRKHYGLSLDEYAGITTNNPARLGEWLAKLGFVEITPAGRVLHWNQDWEEPAREIRQFYGLSDIGEQYLQEAGVIGDPLTERLARAHQYGTREESNEHKLLKLLAIEFADDDEVIGEELLPFAEEYVFPTGDRADVVMRDLSGRFVTIEVEVDISRRDIAGTLQAAKYRAMFAIQQQLDPQDVRAMLIAFTISDEQRQIAERYDIEVHTVHPDLRELAEDI